MLRHHLGALHCAALLFAPGDEEAFGHLTFSCCMTSLKLIRFAYPSPKIHLLIYNPSLINDCLMFERSTSYNFLHKIKRISLSFSHKPCKSYYTVLIEDVHFLSTSQKSSSAAEGENENSKYKCEKMATKSAETSSQFAVCSLNVRLAVGTSLQGA